MNEMDDELEKVDLVDVLLDETNTAPIYMYDENGKELKFEQVAVLPYKGEELYCILKPITKIEGIGDDEAIVFKVDFAEDGEAILKVETDEQIAIEVFDQYYKLLEEEGKELKKRKKAKERKKNEDQ